MQGKTRPGSRQTKMAYVGMQEGLGYASKQVKDSR